MASEGTASRGGSGGFHPEPETAEQTSLVVCTLNEEGNVGEVLSRIPSVVHEIIVVDGNSTDGTVAEAKAADPRVRVLMQTGKGKGSALRQGFAACRGEIIVQMDADGSMDPAEIPRYVDAVRWGADVVKGSRVLSGGGSEDLTRFRRLGNWAFCKSANVIHGSRFTDICYGYMAFRRSALLKLDLVCEGFDIEAELAVKALRAGYVVVEVPTFERERRFGHSNLHAFRDGWTILRTIVAPRQTKPAPTKPARPVAVSSPATFSMAPRRRSPMRE